MTNPMIIMILILKNLEVREMSSNATENIQEFHEFSRYKNPSSNSIFFVFKIKVIIIKMLKKITQAYQ